MRRPGLTATAFQVLALALFLAPISVGAQESSPPSGNKSHAAKKSVLGSVVAPVKSPPLRDIRPITSSTTDHMTGPQQRISVRRAIPAERAVWPRSLAPNGLRDHGPHADRRELRRRRRQRLRASGQRRQGGTQSLYPVDQRQVRRSTTSPGRSSTARPTATRSVYVARRNVRAATTTATRSSSTTCLRIAGSSPSSRSARATDLLAPVRRGVRHRRSARLLVPVRLPHERRELRRLPSLGRVAGQLLHVRPRLQRGGDCLHWAGPVRFRAAQDAGRPPRTGPVHRHDRLLFAAPFPRIWTA